jgi:hypothetical protein
MNDLIAALVKAGAPILGTVIGGPVGTLAGAAIGALAEALGTTPTADAITAAIETNPASAAIIKAVEADKGPGLLEAYLRDVQDARATQLALVDKGSAMAWGAPVISGMIVAGFLALVFALTFKAVPDSQVAYILFGTLSTAFGQVVSYYLGSSAGSARSGDAVRRIAENSSVPTTGAIAGKAIDAAVAAAKSVARK